MTAEVPHRRRRLFWRYTIPLVALVSGALLTSGALEIYFSHQEATAALAAVQREKALAAATRIELFVREIEQQLGWTTHPLLVTGTAALEQRRVDFFRLLRQVPAVTEVSHLDRSGREQIRVSRLAMDVVGSQKDFSGEPKFREASAGRTYFGPVYFRKESEPYMTVSMPGAGGSLGVTVAEVNLKFIWDVISQIRIGKAGHAYVVDSGGQLIAHPDISQVLKKSDLSSLAQVRAARTAPGPPAERPQGTTVAEDLQGRSVVATHAAITPLGWSVIVEQPLAEAREPLHASILRTTVLVLVGVALCVLASLVLARRMVRPIQVLQTGAARIGAGDLGHRIEVQTADELQALADEFNRMTARLQESYAGLEQKVEARTRELQEALEQQTATAEILRVISSSPTDIQPVLDAVAENATRLCDAKDVSIALVEGQVLKVVASYGSMARWWPDEGIPVDRGSVTGRAFVDRQPVHVHDLAAESEDDFPLGKIYQQRGGHRTNLALPLLREGVPIGVIAIRRTEVRPFTDTQIALIQTFADQAVIAIENVRLFQELQARTRELGRSVEQLTALSSVGRAVASTLDLQTVLDTIANHANQLSGADAAAIHEYDEATETFHVRATRGYDVAVEQLVRGTPVRKGQGVLGTVAVTQEVAQVLDVAQAGAYAGPLRPVLLDAGFRAVLAVPLLHEQQLVGGLVVVRKTPGEFPPATIEVLQTFATQSALAIQNARLFRELEDKSRQLEVANQHKSEFLANMSHELRTPLNAVIGFSEVLLERMFGDVNPKQEEYLHDIVASGRHLLSLINDILDLSKIEAGRMELERTAFDLRSAIDNAVTLVRERATRHGIRLEVAVDPGVGVVSGDERKIKQVLLNLLSNALKFTPEGGQVAVRATMANGSVETSVSDTGIGIAPEDQEAIFEEFRQVGSDYARKREGTGLGLTLAKKFVELHGGQIWVKSEVGQGSVFTFTLPLGQGRG